jgi:hypothetical protein
MPIPNTNVYEDIAGLGITTITTLKGDVFVIDTVDRNLASRHCWSKHESGYARAVARVWGKLKTVYLHRLVCLTSDSAPHVDHINGDPSDCRSANLRPCSRSQNLRNQKRKVTNSTGFKGVSLHRQSGRYRARVVGDGSDHVGLFDSPEAAYAAAVEARDARHKEFARHA